MKVVTLCEHLTRGDRSEPHWDTLCIVKAVKGKHYRGWARIKIDGHARVLNRERQDLALDWAAERLGPRIDKRHDAKIALVPIPGHQCTNTSRVESHRVHELATRTAAWITEHGKNCVAEVLPLLHWSKPMRPAHMGGGTRDPLELLKNYRVQGGYRPFQKDRTVVLLDDVVTTGARLCAAERLLGNLGFTVSDRAFAVARTVHQSGDAFKAKAVSYDPWPAEEIEEYER